MITALKTLEHSEVIGDESHSRAYQGILPESYESKLGDFFAKLQGDIESAPYGKNREAWLVGENGTVGDYDFAQQNKATHV